MTSEVRLYVSISDSFLTLQRSDFWSTQADWICGCIRCWRIHSIFATSRWSRTSERRVTDVGSWKEYLEKIHPGINENVILTWFPKATPYGRRFWKLCRNSLLRRKVARRCSYIRDEKIKYTAMGPKDNVLLTSHQQATWYRRRMLNRLRESERTIRHVVWNDFHLCSIFRCRFGCGLEWNGN